MGGSQTPYYLLISGLFVLCLAVAYTYAGKVWTRTSWVNRADDPGEYWLSVGLYYLFGIVLCLGYVASR